MNQISNINATHICTAGAAGMLSAHSIVGHQGFCTPYVHSTIARQISLPASPHSMIGQKFFRQANVHSTIGHQVYLPASTHSTKGRQIFVHASVHSTIEQPIS